MTYRRLGLGAAVALLGVLSAGAVSAKPFAPEVFCDTYPTAPACLGGIPNCKQCHVTTNPVAMNAYGLDVAEAMANYVTPPFLEKNNEFKQNLPAVLMDIESLDSDGDMFSNIDEIDSGTQPGGATSFPVEPVCPDPSEVTDLDYRICEFDYRFVYRKIGIDFCGLAPSYDEMMAFEALGEAEKEDALHTLLDSCLSGEFWRGPNGVLWSIAHRKIRPVATLNNFADYNYDYDLFVYTQIDDHDVREILTAQYLVERVDDGTPEQPKSVYQKTDAVDGQVLQADKRVGMVATSWTLFYNTMFTAMPRGTAAIAYRSFLRLDIAQQEGLFPVAGEPVDYDDSGVAADPVCVACHSTLDPLSYPFSRYNGLQNPLYTYNPERMNQFAVALNNPKLAQVPEAGVIFGQPVDDLVQWGAVASNSDAFFQATAVDYWNAFMGREPDPANAAQYAEFTALWQDLKGHMSVKQMLHSFITTEAYGAP